MILKVITSSFILTQSTAAAPAGRQVMSPAEVHEEVLHVSMRGLQRNNVTLVLRRACDKPLQGDSVQ